MEAGGFFCLKYDIFNNKMSPYLILTAITGVTITFLSYHDFRVTSG